MQTTFLGRGRGEGYRGGAPAHVLLQKVVQFDAHLVCEPSTAFVRVSRETGDSIKIIQFIASLSGESVEEPESEKRSPGD